MPVRIQRKRTAGWRMPDGAIYVGRPTVWGNPFSVGSMWARRRMEPGGGVKNSGPVYSADEAVRLFRRFTARQVEFRLMVHEHLRGHDLACWCPLDAPCHADVLLELANS